MDLPVNQYRKIEEKLRIYNKPFIEISLLQQLIEKFAPNYKIFQLSSRGLITPVRKGELYLNLLSSEKNKLVATTILAQYGKEKTYAVGGLYLYNQYHFSEQIANRVTVYNTSIHGKRIIAGYNFIFRKVRPSFFRGIEQADAQGYGKYNRMSPERALIEMIKESKGNLEYADDIYEQMSKGNVSEEKLLRLAKKHTSKVVQVLVEKFLKGGKIG